VVFTDASATGVSGGEPTSDTGTVVSQPFDEAGPAVRL